MPKPSNKIRIPLPENQALDMLLKVKPTPDMRKPGPRPSKPKAKRKRPK